MARWRQWVLAGVVAIGSAVVSAATASADRQTAVSDLSGQVEWLSSDSDAWQAAQPNQMLGSGDKIRTGADGRCILSLDDGSVLEVGASAELSLIALSQDASTEQREAIFGLWQGQVRAIVTPAAEGSVFQIETPATTVNVTSTVLVVTINPDGSVSVRSEDGTVQLLREGESRMRLELGTGEEALVEYDPAGGILRITSLTGTFDLVGPDNVLITLADGDTAVYSGGAATFIPASQPVGDAPAADTIGEPVT